MELSVNSFLQGGKYRIVRYISSGGFGCTYEAEHVLLGKRVAIKEFFVKDFCNRDEHTCQVTVGTESKKGLVEKLRRKFIDEARALSALHHPGIVSVSDVFEENGTAYYVMDYIDGCSLSDLVRREGPLSESRVLGYIRQVCAALSYVHAHGRLHLDIKPGNIMIDQDGNAILIDFGASKQYDECDGENTSTLMGRTPGYAPLEQLGYDVVKFLPATDIYAVGATLYKLLTGVTPLSATCLASGESLPPLPTQVSASTRKAVESAMCLNKMQRPQTVVDFLTILPNRESFILEDAKDTVVDGITAGHEVSSDNHNERNVNPIDVSVAKTTDNRKKEFKKLLIVVSAVLVVVALFFVFKCNGEKEEYLEGMVENTGQIGENSVFFDANQEYESDSIYVEQPVNTQSQPTYSYDTVCKRLLGDEELIGYSKEELRIMRNWIFARHGYAFKSRDLQIYFSQFDWYQPQYADVSYMLTDIEKKNIELIKRYE